MIDLARLAADLDRDEGRRSRPYMDTVGKITIGVGRNLSDVGLSDDEIDYLRNNDIAHVVTDLGTFAWFEALDPVRQRVLANLRFNLGPGRFRGFKRTLATVADGDFGAGAKAMLNSVWAQQVGARATRLAAMMRTGQEPVNT